MTQITYRKNISNVTIKDYDDWINRFVETYSRFSHSVYALGNISFPGLSDIDILIIPKEKYLNSILFDLSKTSFNSKPFFLHNPFIVPINNIEILQHIYFDNLSLINGKDLLKNSHYNSNLDCIALVESFYSMKNYQISLKHVGVNDIPILSSLRYTIKLFNNVFKRDIQDSYSIRIDELRSKFFSSDMAQSLNQMNNLFNSALKEIEVEINLLDLKPNNILNFNKYLELGVSEEELVQTLKIRKDYNQSLIHNNFDYGSVIRTSLYPLKRPSLFFRSKRKLYFLFNRL